MRDIQKDIQDELNKIEDTHRVRILYAVESGSRAWGFASPDSDYDVRFIYMRPLEDYLSIEPVRDVIEWKLDEVLDINGWDLKKALAAYGKGNPNLMEWANSPIVYRDTPEWQSIRPVILSYFSEKASMCHYYGTAHSTYAGFLMGDTVRYKKYLYALRPLLCNKWIERVHSIPPVLFSELLALFDGTDPELDDALYEGIQHLLEQKAVTDEKQYRPAIGVITDFIAGECARQKQICDSLPDDRRHDYMDLNRIFRHIIRDFMQK